MKYISILLLLSLFGCTPETQEEKIQRKLAVGTVKVNSVAYYKDSRTNLCFAFAWGGGTFISGGNGSTGGPVFTNVPCTPEVEKMVTFAPDYLRSTD